MFQSYLIYICVQQSDMQRLRLIEPLSLLLFDLKEGDVMIVAAIWRFMNLVGFIGV